MTRYFPRGLLYLWFSIAALGFLMILAHAALHFLPDSAPYLPAWLPRRVVRAMLVEFVFLDFYATGVLGIVLGWQELARIHTLSLETKAQAAVNTGRIDAHDVQIDSHTETIRRILEAGRERHGPKPGGDAP